MKPKKVMVGVCAECGKLHVRTSPTDVAVCECSSAVQVQLKPAEVFRVWLLKTDTEEFVVEKLGECRRKA